ncbi:MAG: transglycosylase domain-containing protein [Eubacteriales bacterium]
MEKEQKPKKRRKRKHIIVRVLITLFKVIGTILLIGITTGAILACFAAVYIKTVIIPQSSLDFDSFLINENSVMYAVDPVTGNTVEQVTLLATSSSIEKQYEDFPSHLVEATIAIEDKRFLEHDGVDWLRTAAAVIYMFTGDDIQGGSTLTQQTIKNLTQFNDITVKRKVIEIFRALDVDANYSKEDIITKYLNIIYLGEGCEGVGAASWEYFDKDVSELTLAQSASLISITNNPSIYSPYATLITTNSTTGQKETGYDRNKDRQELVLYLMLEQGKISQAEHDAAVAEDLNFSRSAEEEEPDVVYTWYEEQVISDVRKDLMAQYGYTEKAANSLLSTGGLSIYSLVDLDVQQVAESIYEDWSNLDYPSKNGQPLQSAITIIDNQTGDIAAMVGQMGEKTLNLGMNFASEARRQPGSSIKPLSVYAPALDLGLITPYSIIDDYPYQVLGGSAWPVNAHGYYSGMINVISAVRSSHNTVAVRIVADLLTPETSYQYAENVFHLDLEDGVMVGDMMMSDIAVAPLALGGLTTGVTTREMAQAFSTFPNQGVYTHSRTYTIVKDKDGNVILDNRQLQEVAIQETTASYINTLLKGVVSSGTGTSARFNGMTIAGKTGTTSNKYDVWFVGYTPYYTAAVWVGYEYNEQVTAVYGTPGIMWKSVMEPLHVELENIDFSTPSGQSSYSYCLDSGLRANEYCSIDVRGTRVATGQAFSGHAPSETCTVHTEAATVRICVDSVVTNEEGETVGYCLAGDLCPELSVKTVAYLDYDREQMGSAKAADDAYLFSRLNLTPCTIHVDGWTDDLVPLDPETGLPLFPIDPETGEYIIPVDPTTGLPIWPPIDSGVPGVTVPVIPNLPSTDTPDSSDQPEEPTPEEDIIIPVIPTLPDSPVNPEATIPGVG